MDSRNFELEDLESGRRAASQHAHNVSSDSSSSDLVSSDALQYINQFAYSNARDTLVPKPRARSSDQPRRASDNPFDYGDSKFETYPRPITKKNVYSITLFVVAVWLVGLVTYSRHSHHGKLEESYKDYNTTAAFGLNSTASAIMSSTSSSSSASASASAVTSDNLKRLALEDYRDGKFFVFEKPYNFIQPPSSHGSKSDEGLYYGPGKTHYIAKKLSDSKFSQKIAPRSFVYNEKKYTVSAVDPAFNLKTTIIKTNPETQWRHSSFSQYFLYDAVSGKATPLYAPVNGQVPKVSFAQWSPNYNYVSFVYENNLYIHDVATDNVSQVTSDGSADIFNGKPDWVYEEEVIASDRLLWWSPNEENLVFVKTNDTAVPVYEIDYYTKNTDTKYPTHKPIKYPKPGYANPLLQVVNYNVKSGAVATLDHSDADGEKLGAEFIVYDVFWLNDNDFIVKEADRESNVLHYRFYDHQTGNSKVVRTIDAEKEFGGWIDKTHVKVIPKSSEHGRNKDGYVDLIVDKNGFNHLAYFESSSSEPSKILTEGNFDDKTDFLAFDSDLDIFYFTSTKQSSMSGHVYSVKLDISDSNVPNLTALTKDDELGIYEPRFSPSARFVSLNYKGPRLPTQKIVDLHITTHEPYFTDIQSIINDKSAVEAHKEYAMPLKKYMEITVDPKNNISVNVLETKPHNFDPTKKYPLLVNFYGGPGSQRVQSRYDVGFSDAVTSSLDAVVLLIDPRGTDSKGWSFKKWAKNNIGYWEPKDIIAATERYINDNNYVDAEKTVAWGWSYSGFVTLKTLEVDTEQVFKYGAAVAPVTDWRLYDSIYTERYINTPENDPQGYKHATVGATNIDNFKKKKRFLIMHGTGDDNVHIQNTYTLLDKFNLAGIENFDMKIFPDSDHSIYYHNANTIVYDKLFKWVKDAFNGSLDRLSN